MIDQYRQSTNTAWMGQLRRALKFLYPQRRRIVISILCSIGLAVSLAGSLSALQPILRIFMTEKDGPRAAVFKMAASRTLRAGLHGYDRGSHDFVIDVPPSGVVIATVHDGSPLQAAGVKQGHVLFSPDPTQTRARFLEQLGTAGQPLAVRSAAPTEPVGRDIQVAPDTLSSWEGALVRGLRRLGRLLPTDTSQQATRRALFVALTGVFLLVLFSNVCRFVSQYLILIASNRAVMDLRRQMYRTVMYLPITWFGRNLSETMSRVVTDCRDVERGYRALFGKLTTEPIKIVALLIGAIYTDWRITVFAAVAGPLGLLIVSRLGRKIRKANRRLLSGYAYMLGVINAALAGVKVVRAYNQQTGERRRMWQAERRLLKQIIKIGRFEALTSPLLELMTVGLALIGVVVLADYVFSGRLPPERFFGLMVFMVFIFDAIRKIAVVYPRLAKADGAAQRVFELIDMPVESHPDRRLPAIPPFAQQIEFRNVTYTYPGATQPAIQELDLSIPKGRKVALVGPNGSGKTTCIGLLERFLDCDSGHILVDGRDLTQHSISSWREQISLITQDAVVFALSARDNIAYGRPQASAEQVIQAARTAGAHEFIERLPEGYDTVLGEYGATLSGGERQRLALARAILRDAPIFLFDEATSQIDAESEQKIHQATRVFMRSRTSVAIAHRLNTIIDADQVVVLDRGRRVDAGTHAELLERCEFYRTLYQTFARPE